MRRRKNNPPSHFLQNVKALQAKHQDVLIPMPWCLKKRRKNTKKEQPEGFI